MIGRGSGFSHIDSSQATAFHTGSSYSDINIPEMKVSSNKLNLTCKLDKNVDPFLTYFITINRTSDVKDEGARTFNVLLNNLNDSILTKSRDCGRSLKVIVDMNVSSGTDALGKVHEIVKHTHTLECI